MRVTNSINAFNRGRISSKALARTDLTRTSLAAETQTNLIPRVLGSAQVRPGLEYTGTRAINGATDTTYPFTTIPFVFASDDLAEIEHNTTGIRIWVDDELISRPNITAPTITNGSFATNLTGWTDGDESGAASTWDGYLALLGTGTNRAIRYQEITVTSTNEVHALNVIIQRGPVVLKIGTTAGTTNYFEGILKTGEHSLAFTPTGNFFIHFSSALDYTVQVDSVSIQEDTSTLLNTTISANLPKNWAQSADVVYEAVSATRAPVMIERRNNDSWSIVRYEPEDGPFGAINTSEITMTPSAISGDITLTTNKAYWETSDNHNGELFKLVSAGQNVTASVTAQNTFTDSIFVTGVGTSRVFAVSISNTFSATVTLQRSEDDSTWEDVETYTAVTAIAYDDELDNLQYYYRIGVKTGDFTSGTADLLLSYNGGSRIGVVKITGVNSTTEAEGVVLSHLGSTAATEDWYRSQWSELQGYPTAVAFFEGRLWWAGKGRVWGSVVDGYSSFDDEVVGDSGPINRILGQGAFDDVSWMLPLDRLLVGTPTGILTCKSTAFDEPLTPTNFNIKTASDEGAANLRAVSDGQVGYYIHRSGNKIYQLQYSGETNNYRAVDLCSVIPEIGEPYFTQLAVQKAPDTRIHCIRNDGTVGLLVKDNDENVLSWVDVNCSQGDINNVFVLPSELGELEDRVYYDVDIRETSGAPMTHRLKWALESEAEGGTSNKMLDYFFFASGVSVTTITGLSILGDAVDEGSISEVSLWANGAYVGEFVPTLSGEITPGIGTITSYCVGINYTWQYKSTKLAYGAQLGTSLLQRKRVNQFGIIAENIHPTAFQYGPDFTNLYDLPAVESGQVIDADTIRSTYDEETFPFDGEWSTDSRICLQGSAPKPCTLLALIYSLETIDKA